LQARPPAKPARHSLEAKPMADGQGEAAWGTSGQVAPLILYGWQNFTACRPNHKMSKLTGTKIDFQMISCFSRNILMMF